MVCLITCTSCQKEEGLNIIGSMAEGLSSQDLAALIKSCIFRCDPCFQIRVNMLEDTIEEKKAAKAAKSKKPQILVKRSG